jgi:Phospholipase_D-nuclease N-terminal
MVQEIYARALGHKRPIVGGNFRHKNHSGWAKAGWALFIIFLPLLGVFVYLIARPADVEA